VFNNDDEAGGDLFGRKFDRVRIGEDVVTVFFPLKGRTALQVFQRFALGRTRGTNCVTNGSAHYFV
jgi:hypothetical protein